MNARKVAGLSALALVGAVLLAEGFSAWLAIQVLKAVEENES